MGLTDWIEREGSVQKLDSIDSIPDLRSVGKSVAEAAVLERHFEGSCRADASGPPLLQIEPRRR
jgi:hypothetical protein